MTGSSGGYRQLEYVAVTVADGIAQLMLGGPFPMNRYSREGRAEIVQALRLVADDEDVAVVMVTGAGEAFCAGPTDEVIRSLIDDADFQVEVLLNAKAQVQVLLDLDKPLVAAVNGAVGGAAGSLVFLADISIVERHVTFRESRPRLGLAAGNTGVLTWPASMGMARAKRYLLTGDPFSAEEAERFGLVTEVVDEGMSHSKAMEYARRLAASPPLGLRFTKRALHHQLTAALASAELCLALEIVATRTPEATGRLTALIKHS